MISERLRIPDRVEARNGVQLIWLVDNTTVLARTLNDRAVSTGRDNYGFRSAGR